MQKTACSRHVILSGCSGGGKSTLLAALDQRGFVTVEEPGRRIVTEEMRGDGQCLPWVNLGGFARRAITMAIKDRNAVENADDWVFFDRGLVDAAVALEHATGTPAEISLAGQGRFHGQVFLTPPWPQIYQTDGERPQDMAEGIAEYDRLCDAYARLGYETIVLPKVDVGARADFVLRRLSR